jgi:hypothetical protein
MPPRRHIQCLVAFAFTVLCAQPAAVGAIAVFNPSKDNTLFESATGSLSNGQGDYLYVGKTGQNDGLHLRRGLIAFDLSSIPAGSTINSVTLSMRTFRTSPNPLANTVAIALHAALRAWGEGASDADLIGSGAGAPAQAGDATWLHTFFNTSTWTTVGGDFRPAASATTNVSNPVTTYLWSSGTLAADVQAWVNDPSSNFGWFVLGAENIDQSAIAFNSSENPADKPQLTVNFTIPEPSGLALLALGTLAGCRRRRSFPTS